MACDVDSPIAWSDVYELGQAIDQAAEDLNIPDYEKLVPDLRPFEYESVVDASFEQVFDLNPCGGTPLVTKAFINFTLTGHLKEMADAGALAFVNEPDGCLCKTMFVVVPVGGGAYSLEEFAQQGNRAVGCCQSLFVPKAGDLLDYGQHIIPAGYVATYIDRYAGFPVGEPPRTLTGPACTDGGPTISYEIRAANGCYGLQRARRPMSGFFTWPIEKRVFNEMWDRLNQIVEESCGSDGSFKKADGGATIARYCPVTMEDVVYTIKEDGETFDSEPGGITLNLDLPWDSPTNGGEDCDNHGPKVYCATFRHLQAIIDKIALLEPHVSSCPACCCYTSWIIDNKISIALSGWDLGYPCYSTGTGFPQQSRRGERTDINGIYILDVNTSVINCSFDVSTPPGLIIGTSTRYFWGVPGASGSYTCTGTPSIATFDIRLRAFKNFAIPASTFFDVTVLSGGGTGGGTWTFRFDCATLALISVTNNFGSDPGYFSAGTVTVSSI